MCSFTDVMLLLCPLLSGYQACVRRRGREAEGTRLLNERAPKGHRGFESLRLRQFFDFLGVSLLGHFASWVAPG